MGRTIRVENGLLRVPNHPVIPFIEGDGIGPDIWKATRKVLDGAVAKASGGSRKIEWKEALAGEKAFEETGEWLPQTTIDLIAEHVVSIKGPLTTPVGRGIRSLNVTLRQVLDLYACVRPCRYIPGVPSPVKGAREAQCCHLPREYGRCLRRCGMGRRDSRGRRIN